MNERVKFIARYLQHDEPFSLTLAIALLTRLGLDRRLLVRWGSLAIAAVGLFWAVRRVAGV
jgi:hypothetical protein